MDENDLKILIPTKIIIHGPPASGKTKLAMRICQRYGAHYVSIKTMINETLEELQNNIDREKTRTERSARGEDFMDEEEEEDNEEEADGLVAIENWQEQLKDIHSLMAKSEDRKLPDDYVVKMMRDFLSKDICQSKGYVLDGYPKTIEQAKELFGQAAERPERYQEGTIPPTQMGDLGEGDFTEDDTTIGNIIGNASKRIIPNFVFSLEADDDMLCERVMRLPQREIQGTHFEEVQMLKRLAEFRMNNTTENTVLRFFDEAGVHPILIELATTHTGEPKSLDEIFNYMTVILGPPIPGFGISPEEEEELRRLEDEERRLQEEGDRIERQLLEEKATREHQEKMEKWAETFEKIQKEQEKLLAAQSEPLRSYLMKYVFPILSKGLIEVVKIKPDDPIDFLAEYLFKENPEGRMFDPSYTREGEKILEDFESIQEMRTKRSSQS